jgi:hypothetical protein
MALAPLVVSAVALVVAVGGDYRPGGDIAIVEMTTRAVGNHWPLDALWSCGRSDPSSCAYRGTPG